MSKHNDKFAIQMSLIDSMIACQTAISDIGWRILDKSETRIVCKEVSPNATSFTWAAEVEILLENESFEVTMVFLKGSIFGLGPIQSGHLKGQVGNLRNRIELAAGKKKIEEKGTASYSIASELEKLNNLRTQGIISDEEFQHAKSQLLNIK